MYFIPNITLIVIEVYSEMTFHKVIKRMKFFIFVVVFHLWRNSSSSITEVVAPYLLCAIRTLVPLLMRRGIGC
jgi:hypothetical protein